MILETIAIRKVWAAIKAVPWQVYVIGALVAAIPVNGCIQYREGDAAGYDRAQAEHREAEEAARKLQEQSAATATEEREADTGAITTDQEARDNAINSTADTRPSDTSNALNCERLRGAGRDVSHIPACARRQGRT